MEILSLLLVCGAIVAIIVLIGKTRQYSRRLKNVELRLSMLKPLMREVDELREQIKNLGTPGLPKKEEKAVPRKSTPATTTPLPTPAVVSPVAPEEEKPSRTREEWESLIGGKVLNRIGALALIIGIGFFLKFAFDSNWIGETARVLIGIAIGLACVGGAYATNKHGFQIFAQGLVGAGIAILYLAVFASFSFYHLVPQWMAFAMMSAVTVFAFANGMYYDSLAVALLAWAGGFLTPILLSTGEANEIGLFGYMALLDAGLVGLVLKKERWQVLEPLTLAATSLMVLTWYFKYYAEADLWITILFFTLFWGIFFVQDVVRSRTTTAEDLADHIVPALNSILYYIGLYFLINRGHHEWMGSITIALGAVYLGIFFALRTRARLMDYTQIRYTLTAAILLVLATSVQYEGFVQVILLSVEAAFLVWCAARWKLLYLERAGLMLFGLVAIILLYFTNGAFAYAPLSEFSAVLNDRSAAFAVLAASFWLSAVTTRTWDDKNQERISNVLYCAGNICAFLLITVETGDYFRWKELDRGNEAKVTLEFTRMNSFGVLWSIYSIPLCWYGLKNKISPMIASGLAVALIALLFATIAGITYDPIEQYSPILNVRAAALVLLIGGLTFQALMIQRSKGAFEWLADAVGCLQVGIVLLVLVLLTSETRDFFQKNIVLLNQQEGSSVAEVSGLANLQQLSLSGVWLFYSVVLMSLGIWRRYRGMRLVAIGLFGITILKIFVYDLSFLETLYRIFSFIALGVILLAVSYAYQKYKDVIIARE